MHCEKRPFRPWLCEVQELHTIINQEVFDGCLALPKFQLLRKCDIGLDFGWCEGEHSHATKLNNPTKSLCTIGLMNHWPSIQWCIMILAHEMVHQWQWDVYSHERFLQKKRPIMSHGPSFLNFKPKLAEFGIPLKRTY